MSQLIDWHSLYCSSTLCTARKPHKSLWHCGDVVLWCCGTVVLLVVGWLVGWSSVVQLHCGTVWSRNHYTVALSDDTVWYSGTVWWHCLALCGTLALCGDVVWHGVVTLCGKGRIPGLPAPEMPPLAPASCHTSLPSHQCIAMLLCI